MTRILHHKVVDQVFYYLFMIQDYYISYRQEAQEFFSFIDTNDTFLVIIPYIRRVFKDIL